MSGCWRRWYSSNWTGGGTLNLRMMGNPDVDIIESSRAVSPTGRTANQATSEWLNEFDLGTISHQNMLFRIIPDRYLEVFCNELSLQSAQFFQFPHECKGRMNGTRGSFPLHFQRIVPDPSCVKISGAYAFQSASIFSFESTTALCLLKLFCQTLHYKEPKLWGQKLPSYCFEPKSSFHTHADMLKPKFSSFSVFGILVLDDLILGLGFPSARPSRGKSQNSGHHEQIQRTICGASSPYWSEMMVTDEKTVSNEKGFERFSNEVFGLLLSTQDTDVALLPLPNDRQRWKSEKPCLSVKIYLRAYMTHQRKTSSFPCIGVMAQL